MDLLADENLDAPLVMWLREQGHNVRWFLCLPAESCAKSRGLTDLTEVGSGACASRYWHGNCG